jgi:hypothetical protein
LVGGPVLVGKPELALMMGADATAEDGSMAVLQAEQICSWQVGNWSAADADGRLL